MTQQPSTPATQQPSTTTTQQPSTTATQKVERKTEAETGVSQELLDEYYDAVDAANAAALAANQPPVTTSGTGTASAGQPGAASKAQQPAENKAVSQPTATPAKPKAE